jgi:8-oxo-dGTP diphosphatase
MWRRLSLDSVRVEVVAAIVRRNGKILITRRLDHAHLGGLWEFPGGKVEPGESLEEALLREIREELGMEIVVGPEIFTIEHDYPTKSVRLHFFDCGVIQGEPQALDVSDLRWVTPLQLADFEFPPADAELIRKLIAGK